MRAAILVTGDEVLGGRVRERNAGFLSRYLGARGIRVVETVIVGDTLEVIRDALTRLLETGVDLVCTSGGLGPTYDDLTMAAVAEATGRPLRVDPAALALVEERSRGVGRRYGLDEASLDRMRRKQASLPEGGVVLPPAGTAPGCALTYDGTAIVVLPGPPWECETIWATAVTIEPLASLFARAPGLTTRTLRLWSVVEAELVDVLDPLGPAHLDRIGTYTREGELEIVVPEVLGAQVETLLGDAFPTALFATDDRHVDEIVASALVTAGQTLAVGESCTGGGLGARLTAQPGASRWFVGGAITYANEAKTRLLGVDPAIIATHGAVSAECASAMAEGARAVTGATWSVGITGVAGPDGGTPEKPVGLVWIAVDGPHGTVAYEHRFWRGDREGVRRRAHTAALHHLREALAP